MYYLDRSSAETFASGQLESSQGHKGAEGNQQMGQEAFGVVRSRRRDEF
jgi:hypothetical protein